MRVKICRLSAHGLNGRLEAEISGKLEQHQVGKLLTTIIGIGDCTAAMLLAELGDPARFQSAGALTAYVGLCPGRKHSGKHQTRRTES
jgi:transposase